MCYSKEKNGKMILFATYPATPACAACIRCPSTSLAPAAPAGGMRRSDVTICWIRPNAFSGLASASWWDTNKRGTATLDYVEEMLMLKNQTSNIGG
jgi:hypothetical protein